VLNDPWYQVITDLTSLFADGSQEFFASQHIVPVLVPVSTAAVTSPIGVGSDSEPVLVTVHGSDVYLADPMQYSLELLLRQKITRDAVGAGPAGVYYIMPCFRGEEHDASHLNEFFHSEAEITGGIDDVMRVVEMYVRHLATRLLSDRVAGRITAGGRTLGHLERVARGDAFERLSYREACRALAGSDYVTSSRAGVQLISRPGELKLIELVGEPLWLVDPPSELVPFYQASRPDGTAEAADLVLEVAGETVGCGARQATGQGVRDQLAAHEVDVGPYQWYVRMKDTCPLRTAGFGLGLERFMQWILGHGDIRDLQVMPRLKGIASAF
jgi:asparaginyl-tRNA synthetase